MRDDNSAFRQAPKPIPEFFDVQATVKWYSESKGFGFAAARDGSGDIFIHASIIQDRGYTSLGEHDEIVIDVARSQRGRQAVSLRSLTRAAPQRFSPSGGGERPSPRQSQRHAVSRVQGAVKWFNETKGFGFIAPDDGGKDIFVHITAVQRSGIGALSQGMRVSADLHMGQKGPEAANLAAL